MLGSIDVGWLQAAHRRIRSASRRSRTRNASDRALAVYGVSVIASAAVLVRRYRRSGSVVRTQIRWVAAAGIVPIVLFLLVLAVGNVILDDAVGDVLWSAWILSTTLLPIAIGIAVLRYRLYDIDRIVSRSIAWAIVTGDPGCDVRHHDRRAPGIASSVTQSRTIAVAASTLAAASLFQPVRRRVQRIRRPPVRSGTASTATSTAIAFAERLREVWPRWPARATSWAPSMVGEALRREACGCGGPSR